MATQNFAITPVRALRDDIIPTIASCLLFIANFALILIIPTDVIIGLLSGETVSSIFLRVTAGSNKLLQTSILILVIYLIAYVFLLLGRGNSNVRSIAGSLVYAYAFASAILLGLASWFLIQNGQSQGSAYFSVVLTTLVLAIFSIILLPMYGRKTQPIMLLFIGVLLTQVTSWVFFYWDHTKIASNWVFVENLALLFYALLLAAIYWRLPKEKP